MSDEADSWVFPVLDAEEKYSYDVNGLENEQLLTHADSNKGPSSSMNEKESNSNDLEFWQEENTYARVLIETVLALICAFIYIHLIMNRFFHEMQSLRDDVQNLKDSIKKGHIDDSLLQNDLIIIQSVANLLHRNLCRQRISAMYQEETLLDLVPFVLEHALNNTALWLGALRNKAGNAMEMIYESAFNRFENSIEFITSATSVMTSVTTMFKSTLSSLKTVVINSINAISHGNKTKMF